MALPRHEATVAVPKLNVIKEWTVGSSSIPSTLNSLTLHRRQWAQVSSPENLAAFNAKLRVLRFCTVQAAPADGYDNLLELLTGQ